MIVAIILLGICMLLSILSFVINVRTKRGIQTLNENLEILNNNQEVLFQKLEVVALKLNYVLPGVVLSSEKD